jgi:PAS domain S-box-containing protein
MKRKRIEEELRKSEAKYRNLVETISDFIWEHDERGILTYVSPQARAMIGYAPDEMVGKRLMDFIASDEARPASSILGECLDKQRPFIALENTTLHKDGHPIAVETDGVPFFDEEGKLRGYRGICRDVTERRLAEQALVKSEERYKRLVESVTDYIYTVKVENGHSASTTHGPACAAVTGYTTDEFSADPHLWYRMVHEEDREQVLKHVQRILAGELPPPMEHRIIHKDGSVRWVRNTFVPQFNEEGLLVAYDGMISDVTQRRMAEDAVKREEAFTENSLNMLSDVFFVLDLEGKLLRWNKRLNDVTGYSDREIVLMKPGDFFLSTDIERISKAIKSVVDKGTFSSELTAVTKDGKQIPYEFRATLMRDYTGSLIGICGVGRDLTERNKFEAQLRYAQKMEAVGTLTGGIAHDFNNILNVIIGFGTLVMDRIRDDQLSREQMNEVLTAAERAATLTKRLLMFSRKQVVEVRPVDINELVLGLQKMLARIIRESIDFNLDLADRPLMVLADSGQIEQVLMNLTANARDAMPEGGRLTIGTGPQELDDEYVEAYGYGKTGTYALITVADTGQGMDAETQKKIFEPFFTTKGVGEGTGLGLAISYGIIKQHSGYIKVYSEPGHGTVFKIYLPLIEEMTLPAEKAESPDAVKGGNETILVAEDDASMRKFSSIVLESCGYRVITADDGEDAITKFMENRERISLALLDMIMPKKNGKEVSEAIRKVSPRTKVLFTSGYAIDVIKTKELTEAGYGFIHKPVRSQDLLRKVREFLDK